MSTKRRQHSSKLKAQIAIAAIKGDKTIAQISKEFSITGSRVTAWKKQAVEGISSLFDNNTTIIKGISEEESEKLYAEIGKLKIECDFLKKNLRN